VPLALCFSVVANKRFQTYFFQAAFRGGFFIGRTAWANNHPFSAAASGDTQPHPILQYQLEHFRKNCSHADGEREEAVFSSFGFVSAQLQGFQTCSFAKASPKLKNPRSAWLQFFFKRSKPEKPELRAMSHLCNASFGLLSCHRFMRLP
jgi:hypothetical protein